MADRPNAQKNALQASPPRAPRVRRTGQHLTPEETERAQHTFLRVFSQNANVRSACLEAGIHRDTFYEWKKRDKDFAARYEEAEESANDVIRAAIFRRAVVGIEEPLHFQGRIVTEMGPDGQERPVMVRKYSDTLLIFLAKARMQEFREKRGVDITSSDGSATAPQAQAIFVFPEVLDATDTTDAPTLIREQKRAKATPRVVDATPPKRLAPPTPDARGVSLTADDEE